MPKGNEVTLPDGTVVEMSTTPDESWVENNSIIYVSPTILLHDKTQPRKNIDEDKLEGLKNSVEALGVYDPIDVTPTSHVPWMELTDEEKELPFLVVSGHRRDTAAVDVDLIAVPIHIHIYPNKRAHMSARRVLNLQRENLTQLEEAYELMSLVENGIALKKASREFGCSYAHAHQLKNLTKLHPDIQELLSSDLNEDKKLPVTIAYALGGVETPTIKELEDLDSKNIPENLYSLKDDDLRFLLQKYFLREIRSKNMRAKRAVDFIHGQVQELPSYKKSGQSGKREEKFRPRNRISILSTWINTFIDSTVPEWPLVEFDRILHNSSYLDLENYIKNLKLIISRAQQVISLLEKIKKKKKKLDHVDVDYVVARYFKGTSLIATHGHITILQFHEYEAGGNLAHQRDGTPRPPEYPEQKETNKELATA